MDPAVQTLVERASGYFVALAFAALGTYLLKVAYLDRLADLERSGASTGAHVRRAAPGATLVLCAVLIAGLSALGGGAPTGGSAVAATVEKETAPPPAPAPAVAAAPTPPKSPPVPDKESQARAAIRRVLRSDLENASLLQSLPPQPNFAAVQSSSLISVGRNLQSTLDWLDSAVDVHQKIVDRMSAIRLEDCPSDFQAAYVDHTRAWTDQRDAIQSMRTSTRELVTLTEQSTGVVPTGNPAAVQRITAAMQAAADAEKTNLIAIRDTWFEVRKASLRYGVEPQDFEAAAGGASTGPRLAPQ